MTVSDFNILILTLKITTSDDIVIARQRVRQITTLLNFNLQNQTKIATVVSEIARNACQYAGGGKIEYFVNKESDIQYFIVKISDKGPGIKNMDEILNGNFLEKNGRGLGILGAKRLMDKFIIHSSPNKGTEIIASMQLPLLTPFITSEFLAKITLDLAKNRPKSASDEVLQQNQELLLTLASLNRAKEELEERVLERTSQLAKTNDALKQEIEERTKMEEWIQQHQNELAQAERINSMGEMASALAHELNQPLASITSYIQGCVRRLEGNHFEKQEIINVMKLVAEQSERAGAIMHRIKDFASKGELKLNDSDINILLKETLIVMQYELEKQNIKIRLKLCDSLPAINLDIIQIQQAITNLIRNAIQAMNEANIKLPKITITTDKHDYDKIEINVLDNGPGLQVDDTQLLLQPYFTTKENGMGIGLSITRTIIEAHSGKLLIKNNPLGGAWFQIILPITFEKVQNDN